MLLKLEFRTAEIILVPFNFICKRLVLTFHFSVAQIDEAIEHVHDELCALRTERLRLRMQNSEFGKCIRMLSEAGAEHTRMLIADVHSTGFISHYNMILRKRDTIMPEPSLRERDRGMHAPSASENSPLVPQNVDMQEISSRTRTADDVENPEAGSLRELESRNTISESPACCPSPTESDYSISIAQTVRQEVGLQLFGPDSPSSLERLPPQTVTWEETDGTSQKESDWGVMQTPSDPKQQSSDKDQLIPEFKWDSETKTWISPSSLTTMLQFAKQPAPGSEVLPDDTGT